VFSVSHGEKKLNISQSTESDGCKIIDGLDINTSLIAIVINSKTRLE
jgi:hypothetical protein